MKITLSLGRAFVLGRWLRSLLLSPATFLLLPWLPLIVGDFVLEYLPRALSPLVVILGGLLLPGIAISLGTAMVQTTTSRQVYSRGRAFRFSGVAFLVFIFGLGVEDHFYFVRLIGSQKAFYGLSALLAFLAGFLLRAFEQYEINSGSVKVNMVSENPNWL